jgi:Flp pilus assembly protein TadD
MSDRLETLASILAQDPANKLARYGLAMEFIKAGRLAEAVTEFRTLVASHPDYAYAYFHLGQTLERLDRKDEARQAYTQGLKAADHASDAHARSELEGALAML